MQRPLARRMKGRESTRQSQIRQAFNSPFWALLSQPHESGGGIDFHRWCHAVQHCNTPTNAVDFEQREVRDNRYDGHAVRKPPPGTARRAMRLA